MALVLKTCVLILSREPNRDISDYQVNERAPTDEDITRVLCSLSWQIKHNPERQTQIQQYLQRWGCWFYAGLKEIDAFMTCVHMTLPSLGMIPGQPRHSHDSFGTR